MRKVLLAGVALGAVSALISASPARAQSTPAPPPAVFPVTSETDLAGMNGPSLNGAAPGSVQVNLGGRLFSSIWFMNNPPGTPGYAKTAEPILGNYFFLFPGFDYASPSGWHFGVQAELRSTNATQGSALPPGAVAGCATNGQTCASQPWWHQAWGYVSSANFGKFQFGTPPGADTALAVGTADDFGTGVFFGWFSTNPYVPWVMQDAEDNYTFQQKLLYTSPTFAGFTGAVSYEPTAVGMNVSDNLTQNAPPGSDVLLSRNRVEIAGQYKGTFGAFGVSASGGYAWAQAEKAGDVKVGQNVSMGDAAAQFTFAGFEVEGGWAGGMYNYAIVDDGNPRGPAPIGAKLTQAADAGVGYGAGPFKVGLVYYHVDYDQGEFDPSLLGKRGTTNGYGFGGSYTVGPGVVLYVDAFTAVTESLGINNGSTPPGQHQHPTGAGLGTFFTW